MPLDVKQIFGLGRVRVWKDFAVCTARTMRRNPIIKAIFKPIFKVAAVFITQTVLLTHNLFINTRVFLIRHPSISNFFRPISDMVRNSNWAQEFERARFRWLNETLGDVEPVRSHLSNGKPRVVLVIGTLGPGGSERQVVNTAIGLKESGIVHVSVLCQALRNDAECFFVNDLESKDIEVSELSTGQRSLESFPGRPDTFKRMAVGLSRSCLIQIDAYAAFFRWVKPAVVHAWLDEVNVKAGLGAVLAGVPRVILSCRSVAPYNFLIYKRYMYPAYRVLLEKPNVQMVCNSVAGKLSYAKWLSIPEQNVAVVRNGFGNEFFKRPCGDEVRKWKLRNELDGAEIIVGTVTRFNEEKNPFLWIDFAARLSNRDPRIQFVMVGAGPLLNRVRKYAKRVGIVDRIKFTGLSKSTKVAMGAFDVFVFTSRLEGLPNAVIEAQASGVPVVMTNAGGAPEAILPGVTGIVVNEADPQRLADATWEVLSEAYWRDVSHTKATKFAREMFSMSEMTAKTMSLYKCWRSDLAASGTIWES